MPKKEVTDKKRHVDHREHRYSISEPKNDDPTLVVCPKCEKMAKVFLSDTQPKIEFSVKVVCSNCGFVKQKTTNEREFYWYEDDPSDSFFGYKLWMKTSCCGNSLWAFNHRHLEFIESFVQAELRENPKDNLGYFNSSLVSRLPKWIKSGKNRKRILEGLAKLRALGEL